MVATASGRSPCATTARTTTATGSSTATIQAAPTQRGAGQRSRPARECNNGKDDDRDRFVDSDDPGCADGSEAPVNERPARECNNGMDDDRDRFVDSDDPGCADDSEAPV